MHLGALKAEDARRWNSYFGILSILCVTAFRPCVAVAEPSRAEIAAIVQRQEMRPTPTVEFVAGRWDVISEAKPIFDPMSELPGVHGPIEDLTFMIYDDEAEATFWQDRENQSLDEKVKKQAADFNHKIVATGSCGESGGQPFYASFVITTCEGETFLSVLNYSQQRFEPWRMHLITGNQSKTDMLILELGTKTGGRHLVAFRRSDKPPTK